MGSIQAAIVLLEMVLEMEEDGLVEDVVVLMETTTGFLTLLDPFPLDHLILDDADGNFFPLFLIVGQFFS